MENLLIGVDSKQFVPGLRSGPARLFNHRWFSPVYDNQTIIRALALLPPEVPPFEMIFASGGLELAAARALADQLLPPRLRGEVHFLEGKLRRQELLNELARADVFVSMSHSDGTATSVLEAMMCGVFPVLSDIPANRVLIDAAAGIGSLVPVADAAALAAELSRRIAEVDRLRATAADIRAHVLRFAASSATHATLARRLADIAHSNEMSPGFV